ncbi:MAG: hypothetical protein ACYTKD_27655, partial [Planctomycetota bacterium]
SSDQWGPIPRWANTSPHTESELEKRLGPAIVDKLTGGKRAQWSWQLDAYESRAGRGKRLKSQGKTVWEGKAIREWAGRTIERGTKPLRAPGVEIDGNTFAIHKNDATLKATFVAPRELALDFVEQWALVINFKSNVSRVASKALLAEGRDSFPAVATLQKGAPPVVRVAGDGLDATVTVGRRTVRFDGTKIVFGTTD